MFKKSIKNVGFKRGRQSLLMIGLTILKKYADLGQVKKIKDYKGTIAYDTKIGILAAKKSPYGDIVSVSKQIWDKALKESKKILLYIQSTGYIYEFDPFKITETTMNLRGNTEMVNFDIRNGINIFRKMLYDGNFSDRESKQKADYMKFNI